MTEPPPIDADAPHEQRLPWTPFEVRSCVAPDGGRVMLYANSRYTVNVRRVKLRLFEDRPQPVYRLGISNVDHSARHDWRDFQRIKNEICGPESEAFELYPAESRKLDPSNYFLLWVLPKGFRIPAGVSYRCVLPADQAAAPQRAFESDPGPVGTLPNLYELRAELVGVGPQGWKRLLDEGPNDP